MRTLLLSLLCLAVPALALTAPARPNIVYIIADDHAYRDFGFMGSKEALTPHLDKLASQSARFPNGYVTTSLCSPSLGVMLTGRYPHQSGLTYNHPPPGNSGFAKMQSRAEYEKVRSPAFGLLRNQPTLPRTIGQLGYRSFQTGKFWEGHFSNAGFTEGMTIFEPRPGQDYGGNRTMKNGELAAHGNGDHGLQIGRETMQPIADFIDRVDGKQPFFVWYAPYLPHQPHDSPQRYFDLYKDKGIPAHKIPYLASISQFDDTVGELIAMIESRSLTKNTLIVFISDNGWTPDQKPDKNHPGEFLHTRESKYSPFEDGLRTPILIRWDGQVTPATHQQLVSSVDLLPTVLDALGSPDSIPGLPGRSLWPAAQGSAPLEDQPVFGEIYPGDATALSRPSKDIAYRWVRHGPLKLILPHPHQEKTAWRAYIKEVSLFDVVQDPQEKTNLAKSRPQDVKTLRHLLNQWWKPGNDSNVPKP
ncbi:sulfatase-like hydrolase/transferase [Prosthecobacter sp. SYSU 5D2]|uniref:sulfatase family protein n=1 Tax=Prosthecobacter sp. SYSU 5D2 TaxID=3134134 RepID=UPI0031FEA247